MTVYFVASVAFLVVWFLVLIRYFNLPLAAVLCLSAFGLGTSFPFLVVHMGLQESLVLYALLIPVTGTGIFYLNRHVFEPAFVPAGQPAPVDYAEAVYAVEYSIINGQTASLKEDIREEGRIQEDSEDSGDVDSLQAHEVRVLEERPTEPSVPDQEPIYEENAQEDIETVIESTVSNEEPVLRENTAQAAADLILPEVGEAQVPDGIEVAAEVEAEAATKAETERTAEAEPGDIDTEEEVSLLIEGNAAVEISAVAEEQTEDIVPDQVSLSIEGAAELEPKDQQPDEANLSSEDLVSVAVRLTAEGEYEEAVRILERVLLTTPAVETLCLAVAEMSTVYQHLGQYRMATDLLKVFLDDPETSAHRSSSLLAQKMRFSAHLDQLLREAGTAELPYHQVPPELVEQAFNATARI